MFNRKKYNAEYRALHKERLTIQRAEYYQANKERLDARNRGWAASHKEVIRTRMAKWRKSNRELANYRVELHRQNNKERYAEKARRRYAEKIGARTLWSNAFFVSEIYHLAKLRTSMTGIKWTVDHIVPLTSQIVCGLHAHTNLRVIPSEENIKKHNRHWPEMP